MCVMRYSVGHESCVVCIYVSSTHKVGEVTAASRLCPLSQSQEERTAVHPLSQPREGLCYGCCAHQERINVSEVPRAPRVSFQPLSLCLAYPRFNEQCAQWDTARQFGATSRAIGDTPLFSLLSVCCHIPLQASTLFPKTRDFLLTLGFLIRNIQLALNHL